MARKNLFLTFFAFSFLLLNFAACSDAGKVPAGEENSQTSESSPTSPQKKPLMKVETQKGLMLVLDADDIDREFLIQTTFAVSDGQNNPLPESLKSRIVKFKDDGINLVMLDVTSIDQPSTEYSVDKIVATFPVVERRSGEIVFDFNFGMRNFLAAPEWYDSDNGTFPVYNELISTTASTLGNVKFENDKTCIEQSLAAVAPAPFGKLSIAVNARYFVSFYSPDKSYTPVKTATPQKYLGYFETTPKVEPMFGTLHTMITRWNPKKQIVWAISESIPEEYREASKEGLLYWNKVFGREVIKVVDAPKDVTAPSPTYNVLQWTNEYLTDFAKADAQYDPRTGEILRAQIFVPTMFAHKILSGFDLLLQTNDLAAKSSKSSIRRNDISEIHEDNTHSISKGSKTFSGKALLVDKNIRLKIAQDFVRVLVAHEIGHTLGLRHNFAASSDSGLTFAEREKIISEYLRTGNIPENIKSPANSVMDYLETEDELILSQIITKRALPFDAYAIGWGYNGNGEVPKYSGLNYCHDTNEGRFIDCKANDAGRNPLDYRSGETMQLFENIPELILNFYINAKASSDPLATRTVAESTPSAAGLASYVASNFFYTLLPLKTDIDIKSIENTFANLNGPNVYDYFDEVDAWLTLMISEAGSYDRIFGIIEPSYFFTTITGFKNRFAELISEENVKSITRGDFTTTSFTSDETALILDESNALFEMMPSRLVTEINSALIEGGFERKANAEDLEAKLAKWASFVLTDGDGAKFTFNRTARTSAATLMNSSGPLPEWLDAYRSDIAIKLRDKLTAIFGVPPEEVNPNKYERSEREWMEDELRIYRSIAGGGNFIVPVKPIGAQDSQGSVNLQNGEDSVEIGGGMIHILQTLIP